MKKRIVSMLTVIAIVTAFLPVIPIPAMAAGAWNGTTVDKSWYNASETSFTISTPAELAGLASLVNDGTTFKNKTIRLTDDLDLGGKEWTPIGGETNQKAFQGTFDGYDCIIRNLNISSSDFTYIGLFGVVSGSVKRLTVMPVSVTVPAEKYGGIIAGYVKGGNLLDCHTVDGAISGGANSKLGGIAGYSATGGSITLCFDDDTAVTHTTQGTGGYAGGIVGYNNSGCKVTGCYNTGDITGGYLAGGIAGSNSGTVSHSYNTGTVKSLSGTYPAAGICGTTSDGAATEYCHNYGSGSGDYLGIGTTQKTGSSPYGTISNCYYLNGKNHSKDTNSKQLTADQFKSLDNFEGWAATGCWGMDSVNFPYPVLNNTVFLYDYKISLYVYNAQDGNYMLAQTIYKDAGEYLTSNDLGDPTSGYTVWTTDKNDFTDASKYKIIDENGFSVTESTNLYAVNVAPQGEGTEAAPYLIPNAPTLEYVRDKINADNEWANKYYALTADIDLNGSEDNQWTPIGNSLTNFTGSFDGRGHTVSGLYINNDGANYRGLFGYSTGQIKNLMVEGTVTGGDYVGGIVGCASGSNAIITACANKAEVHGRTYVGGIAGGTPQVRHSYNTGNVTGENYVGAICGSISSSRYTLDSYFLEGTAEKGYGNLSVDVYGDFALSEEFFKWGYVVYKLNYNTIVSEPPAQDIWGQKIGKDDFPVLLTDDNREGSTVYSASFYRKFDASPGDGLPETVWIDDTLANKGSKFSLTPLLENEEFNAAVAWVLDPDDVNDASKHITDPDDERLVCTGEDITLYAVEAGINNAKTASDGSVTLLKSASPQNIDLKQYISADDGETLNANLTFTITGTNPLAGAAVEGNNLVIPANAEEGKYVFNITATKQPVFALMSAGFSDDTAPFMLTVTIIDLDENADGSAEHPYQIPDAPTLAYVRDKINADSDGNTWADKYYVLTNDITFASGWTPIDNFNGNFDGGLHTVSGLGGEDKLFSALEANANVSKLAIDGGVIADTNGGTIENCLNTNGKIANTNTGTIENCFSTAANTGGTITNCYTASEGGAAAYALQSGQPESIWGQAIGTDTTPVFTTDAAKKVYKVEFKKKDGADFAKAADDAYVNSTGIAELPGFTSEDEKYTFSHWTLDTNTKAAYIAGTAVTQDIVLYAVGEEKYGDTGNTHAITTTYGTAKTQDLSEFVTFATTDGNNGTQTAGSFNYSIEDGNEKLKAAVSNDTITIPDDAPVGNYTITIRASKKTETDVFKLMSVTLGNEAFTFDVEVTVNKANQIITAPTEQTVGSVSVTLNTITGGVNGVKYAVNTENTAPVDADKWQESPAFTGLTKNTTYYFFAKYNGNENYNEAVSSSTEVRTADHTHEWEYTVSGATITATCKNTDGACTDTDGGSVTLAAPTENLVYNTESHNAAVTDTLSTKTGDTVTVKYEYKAAADGSYAETSTTVNAGYYKASITLDTDKIITVEYQIAKATPDYTEPTTPQSAIYGDTLGDLTLPAGFAWDKGDNESVGNVGNNSFTATLTPNDTVNYNTVQKTIIVNVSALPETIINTGDVTTDFINETIGGFAKGTYIITADGDSTEIEVTDGTIPIDNNYFGEDITIVKKAEDANHANSSSLSISIPARPSKPSGVEVTKATDDNAANGKITGVDDTMEYKAADDEAWTQIDGNEVTELLPSTYYVRIAPTDGTFASEAVTAVIGVMDKVTVVFIDGDGNTLDTQIVAPYTTVTYEGDTPTKTATAQFTYEFTDWDKEVGEVTEDTTFTAQFEEHLRSYKIKWIVDAAETETDADYGTMPSYGESNPTKTADEYYTYVFDKWTPDIVAVIGTATYTALFNNIPQSYTVTLNTNGGTVIGEFASYSYGTALALPTAEQITKDGSTFIGWYDNAEFEGEAITEIPADETGNKEYFARWKFNGTTTSEVVDNSGSSAKVEVENLEKLVEELSENIEGDVEVVLEITKENADSESAEQAAIEAIKTTNTVEYYDIALIVNTEKQATAPENISIKIPYDTTRANITVYRYDAAATAKAITLSAENTGSEYYEISDGYITIHTSNFATYAIGYDKTAEPTPTPKHSSGGSSRSKATPTPSPSASPEPTEEPAELPEPTETPEPADRWYTDVPENEWYYSPIKAATDKGLMTAVKDNEFQPELDITRAMFVTVLYRIEGEPETSLYYTFEDILKDWYYEKAIAWGSTNGIIAGYDEKTFAPDDNITREQMAAMLWRYVKYKDIDVSIGENTNILSFNDAESISEYAIPAIQWAYGEDIINGYTDNTLRPLSNTTRAQAAAVLDKIDNIVK